jgi:multicomponent Na+:H+ antiporter subunit E
MRKRETKASDGFFWLWALLTLVWIAISSSLALESVITGALIAAALAYMFARKFAIWRGIRFSPTRLYHFIIYTGVFVVELVRANINMMRYVYAPRLSVEPGVVKVKTNLKSPIGRLALANSISLTPGSLVLDIGKDELLVHCLDMRAIDPKKVTETVSGPFEAHLEKAFG